MSNERTIEKITNKVMGAIDELRELRNQVESTLATFEEIHSDLVDIEFEDY